MQFIKISCDLNNLGQLKQATLWTGSHRLWQVHTEKGWYAIKQLSSDNLALSYAIQGEKVAKEFAKHGISVVTAIPVETTPIIEIADQKFLIFNWQAGKVLSANAVSSQYAYSIGNLLAQLHLTKLDILNITTSRWQNFQVDDSDMPLNLAQQKNIKPLIKDILPQLKLWLENYFSAKQKITNSSVISHGDLLQANVIWESSKPWLIDWEAAGWIHPQIELVGVLINWSGINVGDLDRESFINILQGYQAAGGEINIDENILWASLGSWFAWLSFNMRQLANGEKTAANEITNTLTVLQNFTKAIPVLLNWVKH